MKTHISVALLAACLLCACAVGKNPSSGTEAALAPTALLSTFTLTRTASPQPSTTFTPFPTATIPFPSVTPVPTGPTHQGFRVIEGGFSFKVPEEVEPFTVHTGDTYASITGRNSGVDIDLGNGAFETPVTIQVAVYRWISSWKLAEFHDLRRGPYNPITVGGLDGIVMDLAAGVTGYGRGTDYYEGSLVVIPNGEKFFIARGLIRVNGAPEKWRQTGRSIYQSVLDSVEFTP